MCYYNHVHSMYWSNPTPVAAALYLCDLKSPPLAMGANMTHPHTVAVGNTEYVFPTIIHSYCPLQPNATHYNPSVGKERHNGQLCLYGLPNIHFNIDKYSTKFCYFGHCHIYDQKKLYTRSKNLTYY